MPVKSILLMALKIFAGFMAIFSLLALVIYLMDTFHPVAGLVLFASVCSLVIAYFLHD